MKRVFLYLLLLLAAVTAIGLALSRGPGYVLIAYEGFRYEASLWATLALLGVFVLLLFGLRLLLASFGLVNPWSRRNRSRRTRLAAEQGLLDLIEGRWQRALRHLRRAAEGDPQPLIYYLGAARAAQQLGQPEECDVLLERALDRQPKAELAVALTHAELLEARGEPLAAQETLESMHKRYPRHHHVLRRLAELYRQQAAWSALLGLLPELRKSKAFAAEQLSELEQQAWCGRLGLAGTPDATAEQAPLASLEQAWQQLSAARRQDPELLLAYAAQLQRHAAEDQAEALLRKALKQRYDSRLVAFYGSLRSSTPAQQLKAAEGWLPQHPADAELLLCLGRLCLQNALWGKARDYFEASLQLQRSVSALAELARLQTRLGEVEQSNRLFAEGLQLLGQSLPELPLPGAALPERAGPAG